MYDATTDLVTAAADLGRRDAEREVPYYPLTDDSALIVNRVRDDERIDVVNLESHLANPLQPRGSATLHDPADFAGYVKRLGLPSTSTVWADIDSAAIVAVLDDHADAEQAGWREHRVALDLQPDPDWKAWTDRNNKVFPQMEFAEFLEQQMHSIASPAAADLYEVATTLKANRTVAFKSGVRTSNGDVQFTYEETTDAKAGQKGTLDVPDRIILRLAPYAYTAPVELQAMLRYRINEGHLVMGFTLIQPHNVKRDAFAAIVGQLRDELTVATDDETVEAIPVFLGAAPAALRKR